LEEFYEATLISEGFDPLLSTWFTTLHYLLNSIYGWEREAREDPSNKKLAHALKSAWLKIKKYYALCDQTPVYYAAILLNLTLKVHKLRSMWTEDKQLPWTDRTVAAVREVWRSSYKTQVLTTPSQRSSYLEEADTPYARLQRAKRLCLEVETTEFANQFEAYINTDPLPHSVNPVDY